MDAAVTPMTSKEIADATGLAESSVRQRLLRMRECSPRLMFIAGYRYVEGQTVEARLYQAGDKPDVPYQYKAKKAYVSAPKYDAICDEPDDGWKPRRVCKEPVRIQRDPFVSALFGEYRSGVAA